MPRRDFKAMLNYNHLRIDHRIQLKKLNDVLVETALSIEGMEGVRRDVTARIARGEKTYQLHVPNKKAKLIPIRRNLQSLNTKLEREAASNAYLRSLVFLVSHFESYLSTNVRRVIMAYPRKLLISPKGRKLAVGEKYAVEIRDFLAAASLPVLIAQLAEQRVRDAVYATPEQYLTYFASVCSITLDEENWRFYTELKATRDLHIHAEGRVNSIYLQKSGTMARFALGEFATVDAGYFASVVGCLKAMTSEIYTGLRQKFGNSAELQRVFEAELHD